MAATSAPADVPASSVSTPHLDRVQPHSGRLGGLKKKLITDEVVASINAAHFLQFMNLIKS